MLGRQLLACLSTLVLVSSVVGCEAETVPPSESSEAQLASDARPYFSSVYPPSTREDGALVVEASYDAMVVTDAWIQEPFGAKIVISADRTSATITYRFHRRSVTEPERAIRADEADALDFALQNKVAYVTKNPRPFPPPSERDVQALYEYVKFRVSLVKFMSKREPFVAADVPLEASKLGGYARVEGGLLSVSRSGAPRGTSGYLTVSGAGGPKATGTATIYELATSKLVATASPTSTQMSSTGSGYHFELPNVLLSPDKDYVVVTGTVINAALAGDIRTPPIRVRLAQ